MPNPGEIWLVRFPFSDLTTTKVRPALILAIHKQDILILGIFSKIPSGTLSKNWVLMAETHPKFSQTGLKTSSVIRADKIATIHQSILQTQLGTLPSDQMPLVETVLKKCFESLKRPLHIAQSLIKNA